MSEIDEIDARLAAAINYVEHAQSELNLDNIVMLQDLQTNVAEICAEIAALTHANTSSYREKLSILADKMQNLEIDLRAKKLNVERELKNADKNHSATAAYEKAKNHSSKGDNHHGN